MSSIRDQNRQNILLEYFELMNKVADPTAGRKRKKGEVLAKILSRTKSSLTGARLRREKTGRRGGIQKDISGLLEDDGGGECTPGEPLPLQT